MDLKLATASQEILLGPFLDDDDGVTQKTGLTIANTDIKLFKTGGTTLGNKNSGGATEIATGFYYATLDATDTDTLGPLVIVVQITDCLCVRHEFNVVSAAYYDWVYGSTKPDVNTYSITANAITEAAIADNAFANEHFAAGALTSTEITSAAGCAVASIAANAITATAIAADAIEAAKIKDDAITAAKIATDAIAADAFAQTAADKVWSTAARVLTANTNLGGLEVDLTKIHGTALTETAGQLAAAFIKFFDVATPVLTCESVNQAQDNLTAAETAAAVWNAETGSYGGPGTYGQAVEDTLADTNELQADDYPTSIAAIKTVVDIIQADTDLLDDASGGIADIHTDIGTLQTAVDGITAAVITNAAGTDVAADVIAVKTVVDLCEDILRNQMDIDDGSGAVSLKNDAGVEMLTGSVTDNSTTTTRTRLA